MIQLRKQHPALRHALHPGPGSPEINWHGTRAWRTDWSPESRVAAFHRIGGDSDGADVVYVAMNSHWEGLEFELPDPPQRGKWHVFANTSMSAPEDIHEPGREPLLSDQRKIIVGGRSILILIAR
jgi:isoamylase